MCASECRAQELPAGDAGLRLAVYPSSGGGAPDEERSALL